MKAEWKRKLKTGLITFTMLVSLPAVTTRAESQFPMDPSVLKPWINSNVVGMVTEEFMETYDIQPGDGMYLAPEDRIAVW